MKTFHFGAVTVPVIAVVLFGIGKPAYASTLTINGTFDSSITSLSDAAAIEGAINSAMSLIEADITSPKSISVLSR